MNLAYRIATRFVGVKEWPGALDNPLIMAMLKLDQPWPENDEVSWCSAFANFVCWLLDLPRSKSLAARTWLKVGTPVATADARQGDVVVFRGGGPADPAADGPGHVAFFSRFDGPSYVFVLGGNQSNAVTIARFRVADILGIRRLSPVEA